MRRWKLLPVVMIAAFACGGDEPAAEDQAPVDQAPATDVAMPPAAESPPAQQPTPRVVPPSAPAVQMPLADEPWNPTDTGTVSPGMSRDDVLAVWGSPVTERMMGAWTYLYYRNGCEASCGTFDVVFLENGQVVNAIVRGPGHSYSGVSTSPPGQPGRATKPGEMEG
ncbi:MAG: outer membrane protein assembly factor BamE [Gemmatimonadota bacterium]|nr:outer membrane protein assembly factor BamE [Gemmatimonadota bacterium]MDH5197696.1 outer membrane protein assembly factor BamE [Gemmatimonadota bacterium]